MRSPGAHGARCGGCLLDVGPITVSSGIHAEIARVGMRTPVERKAHLAGGLLPDGGTAWGGGTWS